MKTYNPFLLMLLLLPYASLLAEEVQNKGVRIRHLPQGSILFLELKQVNEELFNREKSTKGFVQLLLVRRNEVYKAGADEIKLAESILNVLPTEEQGQLKYMVGPMSAHASERYIIESDKEVLFVTPYWEDQWKKYDTLSGPLIDVQRCTKAGETKLNGIVYDIYEVSGVYHQGLGVPRQLSDKVDWFRYKVRKIEPDEDSAEPFE